MNKTKIEYLDYTWNPLAMRCSPVSGGCKNCWHIAMAKRLAKNPMVDDDLRKVYTGDGPPAEVADELEAPLHLKRPSRIGVQFMGDWMHPDVSPNMIDDMLEVMAATPQHIYLTLTKRPENFEGKIYGVTEDRPIRALGGGDYLPNLWLGVSVENQETADQRIPDLLRTMTAHRWLSVEPILGEIDIEAYLSEDPDINPPMIMPDWVICGGETGPGARPLHPDWVRSLRDQCQDTGIPFFFKGWGEWAPDCLCHTKKLSQSIPRPRPGKTGVMFRCGKENAGRLLDGREWNEIPDSIYLPK